MSDSKTATAFDWCKRIIEGTGGMNDYERYEVVVWHHSERVHAAYWALKCLANPACEGSQWMLDEIIKRRQEAMAKQGADDVADTAETA